MGWNPTFPWGETLPWRREALTAGGDAGAGMGRQAQEKPHIIGKCVGAAWPEANSTQG